ncbi:MAG: hypothetical protein QXX68_01960 [Candidatus Pacearchaeota archaeon]
MEIKKVLFKMKKNKKAQISSTLSWFVATIVIFFILMIFVFFAGLKNIKDIKNNIVDDVKTVGTAAFLSQEEQRALFYLFEEEVENKKFYYLTEDFIEKIDPFCSNKINPKMEDYLKRLNDKNKIIKICSSFFIVNGLSYIGDGVSAYSKGRANYCFSYPRGKKYPFQTDFKLFSDIEDLSYGYSFFFPEKSFALIKYYIEEC